MRKLALTLATTSLLATGTAAVADEAEDLLREGVGHVKMMTDVNFETMSLVAELSVDFAMLSSITSELLGVYLAVCADFPEYCSKDDASGVANLFADISTQLGDDFARLAALAGSMAAVEEVQQEYQRRVYEFLGKRQDL